MMSLLGMEFTSVWMGFLYIMVFCAVGTVLDRMLGRLVKKVVGTGTAAKLVRLVVFGAVCALVLWGLDVLMDSVTMAWWVIAGLAVLAAAVMVLPAENGQEDR